MSRRLIRERGNLDLCAFFSFILKIWTVFNLHSSVRSTIKIRMCNGFALAFEDLHRVEI